jgi:hypothetical protein
MKKHTFFVYKETVHLYEESDAGDEDLIGTFRRSDDRLFYFEPKDNVKLSAFALQACAKKIDELQLK